MTTTTLKLISFFKKEKKKKNELVMPAAFLWNKLPLIYIEKKKK